MRNLHNLNSKGRTSSGNLQNGHNTLVWTQKTFMVRYLVSFSKFDWEVPRATIFTNQNCAVLQLHFLFNINVYASFIDKYHKSALGSFSTF